MEVTTLMSTLAEARQSARAMASASDSQRQKLLHALADLILAHQESILKANAKDVARMDPTDPKRDRLVLNADRLAQLATATRQVASLPDPTGQCLLSRELPNGLHLEKMSVPLGVIGVIYESRPNVTIDVAALCLRAGNACVLRGGSEAIDSNVALVALVHEALRQVGLPETAATLLPTDRELVAPLLGADRYLDLLIPRGSQGLIDFVRKHATVPTIETGAGVCHTYVAPAADLSKAADIVVNAKVSRPSVCNALDTLLVHQAVAEQLLKHIAPGLHAHGVEIFADEPSHQILSKIGYPTLQVATAEDFGREFLDFKCAIKTVASLEEALEHISRHSSRHSEAIVSEDGEECERFLREVDAAAVYANASTRFTDGGEFGLGAEIGISTQKLHARGPFALEKLVTEKWLLRGNGQVRK